MNCWMGRSSTPFARRISSSRPGVGTPQSGRCAARLPATGSGVRPRPPFGLAPGTTLPAPRNPKAASQPDIHPRPPTGLATTSPFRRPAGKSAYHAVMEAWLHAVVFTVIVMMVSCLTATMKAGSHAKCLV